jgi:hypothetical protein
MELLMHDKRLSAWEVLRALRQAGGMKNGGLAGLTEQGDTRERNATH